MNIHSTRISECYASWCTTCTRSLATQLEESGDWRKRTKTRRSNSWPTFKHRNSATRAIDVAMILCLVYHRYGHGQGQNAATT